MGDLISRSTFVDIVLVFGSATLLLMFRVFWLVMRLRRQKARLVELGLPDIDHLSGRDFEYLVTELFRQNGYSAKTTRYIGDFGCDIVLQNDGIRTVVQAKRCGKRVGVRAIQEVVASKAKYGATEAIVITNNSFTNQAHELARVNRVRLRDRRWLERKLSSLPGPSDRRASA